MSVIIFLWCDADVFLLLRRTGLLTLPMIMFFSIAPLIVLAVWFGENPLDKIRSSLAAMYGLFIGLAFWYIGVRQRDAL